MDATKSWYFYTDKMGDYYVPWRPRKAKFEVIGPGDRDAKPVEIADYLNSKEGEIWVEPSVSRVFSETETEVQGQELPAGCYYHEPGYGGRLPERLRPFELRTEPLIDLDDISKRMEKDINIFLESKDLYEKHGILYKLGILAYGDPGNSKTSAARRTIKNLMHLNPVVIFLNDDLFSRDFIEKIKLTLPDRLKIFIFEELTTHLNNRDLKKLLDFLDGESSLSNCIVIGTTNYPENLPGNIVDRASRFDKLYKFDNPSEGDRTKLIQHILERVPTAQELSLSKGLSIANLKEACLRSLVGKQNLEDSLKSLKLRAELVKKSFSAPKELIGFKSSNDPWDDDD